MRLSNVLVFVCVLLSLTDVFGQDTDTEATDKKIQYSSVLHCGALFGKDGAGVTSNFSFINGIRFNKLGLGVGIGYDDYSRSASFNYYGGGYYVRWKSMPVFASISFDLAQTKQNAVFIQLNSGKSWMWGKTSTQYPTLKEVNGGFMINPMLGWRSKAGRKSFVVSAGYKWQKNHYKVADWSYEYDTNQTLERIVVQFGIGIN